MHGIGSAIDRALEKDRTRATAEYLAEFRTDVEGFVALEVVESCVGDHREMLPAAGVTYRAFVDPSGGSEDAMTLAIAHKTTTPDERVIVDAVREVRPPFSPSAVVDDFAALLQRYRISKVVGDHYGGEFVKEPFRRHGISYEVCKQPKSDLFRDMLPLLNAGHISLPRHDRLIAQIVGLERRVSRAGRDSIDHAPGAHDDIANAVSGVVSAISGVGNAWMNLIWTRVKRGMGGADWSGSWTAAVAVQCAGESQLAGGLCRDAAYATQSAASSPAMIQRPGGLMVCRLRLAGG